MVSRARDTVFNMGTGSAAVYALCGGRALVTPRASQCVCVCVGWMYVCSCVLTGMCVGASARARVVLKVNEK